MEGKAEIEIKNNLPTTSIEVAKTWSYDETNTWPEGVDEVTVGLFKNNLQASKKQHEHIKEQTGGYVTNILRFPGGIPTAKAKLGSNGFNQVTEQLKKLGYGWVDWTAENGDGKDIQNKHRKLQKQEF